MRSYEKRIATRRIDDTFLFDHRLDVLVPSVGPGNSYQPTPAGYAAYSSSARFVVLESTIDVVFTLLIRQRLARYLIWDIVDAKPDQLLNQVGIR
jgi:hypothetical protein